MAMQAVALLITLLLATPVVYGAQHIVGGSSGWVQSGDYSTWAAGETFTVGDTLAIAPTFKEGLWNMDKNLNKPDTGILKNWHPELSARMFNYGSSHGVDQVSQTDYTNCNAGNAIQSYQGGSTTIKLSNPGPMYFMCPTIGHCAGGMKLAVNVVAASTTPSGTTPSPPSTAPTTTPSTTVPPPPPPPAHSGAATISCSMISNLVFGFLLLLATMFAYMG
ncbi:Blue copper protein [Morella rubra]|uniref:Blue copper protein n=1 Tax=Morella rubra TaxID=262757 RepID=A0A6A1VWR4_9ROSI|nr:Blue copper protein [Morella rubra]